jgi:hypothetical protein
VNGRADRATRDPFVVIVIDVTIVVRDVMIVVVIEDAKAMMKQCS